MVRKFLNQTDKFLCTNVKNIFEKCESNFKNVNVYDELKNLQYDPIVQVFGSRSQFEKKVKLKIKLMVGVFFVAIPLIGFLFLSYMFDLDFSYAFLLTLLVATLATIRLDEIVKRYANTRYATSAA